MKKITKTILQINSDTEFLIEPENGVHNRFTFTQGTGVDKKEIGFTLINSDLRTFIDCLKERYVIEVTGNGCDR